MLLLVHADICKASPCFATALPDREDRLDHDKVWRPYDARIHVMHNPKAVQQNCLEEGSDD